MIHVPNSKYSVGLDQARTEVIKSYIVGEVTEVYGKERHKPSLIWKVINTKKTGEFIHFFKSLIRWNFYDDNHLSDSSE